jgi:DNA processing protein
MSILSQSVARLSGELAAVRAPRPGAGEHAGAPDDPDVASEALSRAVLGSVAEPGDGVLGRAVAAVGARQVAEMLLASATPSQLAEAVQEAGEHLDEREAAAGLERWRPRLDHPAFVRSLVQAARVDARLVIPSDPEWPVGLDELGVHAPLAVWVRGRAGALAGAMPAIALVGARAATGYGEHVAMESSSGLVDRGFTVVSGGAYGIDGMAHRSALASGGATVAFLAGGVDRFYPMGHDALLTRIVQTGAVISELPCGAAPTKWRFLQRNRLIAATSAATVVLEAGIRSGSLNTAGHAAALGRPLGAVPGPVTSPASAGCHRLLREYDAVCVVDAEQMAELAGGRPAPRPVEATEAASEHTAVRAESGERTHAVAPSPEALRIMDALSTRSARQLDDLVQRSGMDGGAVMAVLGVLEIHGIAERRHGGWVRRRRR